MESRILSPCGQTPVQFEAVFQYHDGKQYYRSETSEKGIAVYPGYF